MAKKNAPSIMYLDDTTWSISMSTMPQPVQPQQKKSKLPWLIGCGVLLLLAVPVCGIFSAIAIPAFLRSVKKSKEAEANVMTTKMATGAQMYWEMNCAFPAALPPTSDLAASCGGAKAVPSVQDTSVPDALGVSFIDPMYFVYSTEIEEFGDTANYVIRAQADFQCGGPAHTIEVRITGMKDGDTCTAEIQPAVSMHEFE